MENDCETRKERANVLKRHLEKLANVDGLANHSDRNFLQYKIQNLKDYNPSLCNTLMPFGKYDKSVVKRIIKNAKLVRDTGQETYLFDGDVAGMQEIKEKAKQILSDSRGTLSYQDVRFLGKGIIEAPSHRTFSAKQILYLENLAQHAGRSAAQSNGECFNLYSHYRALSSYEVSRFLNFALIGNLGKIGRPKGEYLEAIRNQWFDDETGLGRLRESLKDYCTSRKLSTKPRIYSKMISDMETYFRKNLQSVRC